MHGRYEYMSDFLFYKFIVFAKGKMEGGAEIPAPPTLYIPYAHYLRSIKDIKLSRNAPMLLFSKKYSLISSSDTNW